MDRVLARGSQDVMERYLVYGEHAGWLVFIPERRARELATVVDAWQTSSTWGELRTRVEALGLADEVLAYLGYPDDYPPDAEPLTDDEKQGYTREGEWPSWPAAEMLSWVPKEVAELGESGVSMTSGPALFFDPDRSSEIVAAFEKAGFICRRDDDLVWATYAVH